MNLIFTILWLNQNNYNINYTRKCQDFHQALLQFIQQDITATVTLIIGEFKAA